MEFRFADSDLSRLESDAEFNAGFSRQIVRAYRKVLQVIRAAPDERDFYRMKSLHYEKLQGKRQHQRSMRLTGQWRLILEVEVTEEGRRLVVMGIEDYH
jgi:proteic killer suppression protein